MAPQRTKRNDGDGNLPLVAGIGKWHETLPDLSRDHLYSAVASGELRAIRRGRRILIPRSALLEYLGEAE